MELVVPFDYMLLDALPDEGELVGGVYPLAARVNDLVRQKFAGLGTQKISGRLRSLAFLGLVTNVPIGGSEIGWQRTAEGKKVLATWER